VDSLTLPSFDLPAILAAVLPAIGVAVLRIGDVTMNVFRMVFVVQERRLLAALASAGEAAMWLSAAGIVLTNITPLRAIGYVVGVAAGTAIGMEVARRLRLGMSTVRVYVDADAEDEYGRPLELGWRVASAIRDAGYAATVFRGHGLHGEVDMVLSTVRRRDADHVVEVARSVDATVMAAIDNALNPAAMPAGTSGRA
jgi:uncharacterized protein YebE (UPF0316 family)